ncbi:hypothetical protein BJV82DRAFT_605557 [Fennellomyces sp. T-0311]|nr:hypothetical protein BJV82DRAFT_605557 [Fennellomyces sp. T-0311]
MAKKKRGNKNNNGSQNDLRPPQGRVNKKTRFNTPSPPRSVANAAKPNNSAQSIAANDDFISLDFDLPTVNGLQSGKKRKHNDQDDHDEENGFDLTLFPWLPMKRPGPSSLLPTVKEVLEAETACLLQYLEPRRAETRMRQYLIHKITTVVDSSYPGAEVEVFGSFETNLYLPNSDLDLVVQGNVKLRNLAKALVEAGVCSNPQVIEKAMVPVIKLEDSLTGLKVDITLDSDSGIDSATCVKGLIRAQRGLRPLTLLVKLFLALRRHNEVFTGGLGGYAIVCMVMNFLQMHPLISTNEIDPVANMGTLLLEFLQLYGISFQMEELGIRVTNKGAYFRKKRYTTSKNGKPVYTIEDPMDQDNDIGMKSYNAVSIIRAFRSAYMLLTKRAFELEEQLGHNRISLERQNGLKLSILSKVLYIPKDMMQLRDSISDVYERRLWEGEPAARTFDWSPNEQ